MVQRFASKLLEEQELNKEQIDTVFSLLGQALKAHFEKSAVVTSTEMPYAEGAIDQVTTRRETRVTYPAVGEEDSDSDGLVPLVDSGSETDKPQKRVIFAQTHETTEIESERIRNGQ